MNNLRNLRNEKGLSIPKLHRITGIPVRTLEDWDTNKRIPQSYHRIKRLSDILGCSMDDFMTYKNKCLCGGDICDIEMYQDEDGVNVSITGRFKGTIDRNTAMNMIDFIKNGYDVSVFLNKESGNVTE